jgi:hypothetical protein
MTLAYYSTHHQQYFKILWPDMPETCARGPKNVNVLLLVFNQEVNVDHVHCVHRPFSYVNGFHYSSRT